MRERYRIKKQHIVLRKQTSLTYSHCSSKHANISYIDNRREDCKNQQSNIASKSLYIEVASHVNSITINLNINIIELYRN